MDTKITKTDILIIVIVFCFTLVVSFAFFNRDSGSYFEVVCPDGTYIYPLSQDEEYSFKGIMGESVVKVEDGSVFFVKSPCPNKNCISNGGISKNGEFNACLPNGISITVVNNREEVIDAVSI